jgi:hypothetical protein
MPVDLQTDTCPEQPPSVNKTGSIQLYGAAIFLGAFLLFAVQLILGKYLLPWFGGTPAMWTTCMFFFQMLLLAGYAYSHALAGYFQPRRQSALHIVILGASVLLLIALIFSWHAPLIPDSSWKPRSSEHPIAYLILLLTISAGLPYLVLSTTGPLLQSWFTAAHAGRSPYRLYALSNLGSLLALLSYPVLIEPWLTLKIQAWAWTCAFIVYALLAGTCAFRVRETNRRVELRLDAPDAGPGLIDRLLWLALPAAASVMFLATTNQICQDVAVVPFLWVLPLSLYLLTFVVCFDAGKWYSRRVFHPLFGLSLLLVCFVMNGGLPRHTFAQIASYSFVLFIVCMVCHGELARSKPAPQYLTSFYLMISAGGAVGGIFVALIAPRIFRGYWELQSGLWLAMLLLFFTLMRDRQSWLYCSRAGLPAIAIFAAAMPGVASLGAYGLHDLSGLVPVAAVLIGAWLIARQSASGFDHARARAVPFFCAAALIVFCAVLLGGIYGTSSGAVDISRNFYGVLTVRELNAGSSENRAFTLMHGRVAHGYQFRSDTRSKQPTGYYGVTSGVGRALTSMSQRPDPVKIGLVGLGIGTLAAYARAQDQFRIYEINPEVVRFARDREFFTYLANCPAAVQTVVGDARISLERELQEEQKQNFDLLAIDAFTGDAIPIHLLTREAFQSYLAHMRPDGIIAIHITNTSLDLRPVLLNVARQFHLSYLVIHDSGDQMLTLYSDWVLMAREPHALEALRPFEQKHQLAVGSIPMWTDDFSNLLHVIKR